MVFCDQLDHTENRVQHNVLEGREIFEIEALRFGINICYDTNFSDIAEQVAKAKATLIVCCSNNTFPLGKAEAFRKVHLDLSVSATMTAQLVSSHPSS